MVTLESLVSLAKRRGLVFPSSEIYGGFAAVYDYGPYGVELANNIKAEWWRYMVQLREDIIGLDSSIVMHPKIWEASGHVAGFADPLAECKECHYRVRVDHLLETIGVKADEKMSEEEIRKIFAQNQAKVKCPNCGKNNFTPARKFNLLVKTNLGNFVDDWKSAPTYLRGETCQGIYVNFLNVLNSTRMQIPFGIAQIGKAYRNEITARQFIFRTREFEQMEMQYFLHPKKEMEEYEKLRDYRFQFYLNLGIAKKNLQWHKHENLVFYAQAAYDIEYNFPWGFDELEGVHARSDYDLTQHSKFSGKDLSYIDPVTQEKYLPHIIESSVGVGRTFLMVLAESYCEEKVKGETRLVLKINKHLAPIKAAVFPLLKNKPELVNLARKIFQQVQKQYRAEFDDNGNVGKRYRRQDEIGTPYTITVDFQSLSDNTVTVRSRDTMIQERVDASQINNYLSEKYARK